ncbi:peroxiredoxin-like family protein [Litorihabitans aurantiacus]|uniref:thioredoxin-dependent peroxiredoxin n=1 Tax=Litorihabitans aurantiacus TaxID=1930061 RepID=A0AA37XEU7_9MICO|nr:peroxiredoxin-like family protein [Litorihabitans aurantiacus]GMA31892.1 peroxiredoxin [Litorihabitans aurantiacus]
MTEQTIAQQVDEFNVGFTAQIGPELSAVFDGEQRDLRAGGTPDGVVAVGDALPGATLVTPTGEERSLDAVLGGAPAVLVFYRGSWCPYCNLTLTTYQRDLVGPLGDAGVQLVAISPQTPEASQRSTADGDLGFTLLTDPGNRLAAQLGIVTAPSPQARAAHTTLGFDVADSNADATAAIPFPTVIVVDSSGTVRFVDVHVDYTTRTEVPDILRAVSGLAR